MALYVATVNVPGYLPMNDEPPTFDDPQEAWAYLADERERDEECDDAAEDWSTTFHTLASLAERAHWSQPTVAEWLINNGLNPDGTGVVYGPTPGYDGQHDLGLAYCVTQL